MGAAPWSRVRKSKWLDLNLLCPDPWQELVGRLLGQGAYQLAGRAWEILAFLPLLWAAVCSFRAACLDLTHTNFRSSVVRPECAVD